MEKYASITEVLEYLEQSYQVKICIKDFAGFIPINRELEKAVEPYLAHTAPYCMLVKQEKGRYTRCLCGMRPLHDKCVSHRKGFWGICHAGIREYVVPILLGNEVLGSIQIGSFPGQEELALRSMERLFRSCDAATRDRAARLFHEQINVAPVPVEQLLPVVHLLAEHLAQTYAEFKAVSANMQNPAPTRKSSEYIFVNMAIEYIRQHYTSKITVKQIAKICHCCESQINHTFCRHTGVNISTYTNKVRVEKAKDYLMTTTHRIVEIASMVGFSDPNYFSRVFTELMGIPPTEFRRRYAA